MTALDCVPVDSIGIALIVHDGDDILDELAGLFRRPAWNADAACREHPDVNFHPERNEDVRPAKAVCADCLVRVECLDFALEHAATGIWGGTSEKQRKAIAGGRLAIERALAIRVSIPPPRKKCAEPKRRNGAGACRVCARVCNPTDQNPEDRLRAGLCPADHQRFVRWRKINDGDLAKFINERTAA